MVKTFWQFLEEKKRLNEKLSPNQMVQTMASLIDAPGGATGGVSDMSRQFAQDYPGISASIASQPGTEAAKAALDAAKQKRRPPERETIPPNIKALPGTQPR